LPPENSRFCLPCAFRWPVWSKFTRCRFRQIAA